MGVEPLMVFIISSLCASVHCRTFNWFREVGVICEPNGWTRQAYWIFNLHWRTFREPSDYWGIINYDDLCQWWKQTIHQIIKLLNAQYVENASFSTVDNQLWAPNRRFHRKMLTKTNISFQGTDSVGSYFSNI